MDDMFKAVERHEAENYYKIDLIIVCGDCQTIRHFDDLRCLAVPQKYKRLGDFHDYYSGKKQVPRLTIFVGGNHEASNYLMALPYGGWVCDNFYYMGYAGVINYRGLRIGGISGIYNYHSCNKGRFERMPLNDQSMRSIYHTRRLDVFRLQLLSKNIVNNKMFDVFISHDWPARIYEHGNLAQLLRFKPFFKEDVDSREGLGNPLTQPLVQLLKPRRWFAAHMHCKFYAKVMHDSPKEHCTEFLSLNKIEGKRQFDEYLDLKPINLNDELATTSGVSGTGVADDRESNELYYDPEWLTILRKTVALEINTRNNVPCPNLTDGSAHSYYPTDEEIQETVEMMTKTGGLQIKRNFCMSEPVIYNRPDGQPESIDKYRTEYFPNPQHVELCSRIGIPDQVAVKSNDPPEVTDNMRARVSSRKNHDRNSSRRPQTNPAYPYRNYHLQATIPRSGEQCRNNPPMKKRAIDLDEDGCLPFSVDKSGDRP